MLTAERVREGEGDGNAGVEDVVGVVAVSEGH